MPAEPFKTARQKGRLSPLKLEHAVLRTTHVQPMVDWYLKVLEAEITFSSPTIAFLCYDEQNHRIAFVNRPGTMPRTGVPDLLERVIVARTPRAPDVMEAIAWALKQHNIADPWSMISLADIPERE